VAGEVVFVKRCEIIAMRLSCLLLSRLKAVLSNQSFTLFLCASEIASSGFAASSMIIRSSPRPVKIPPTEVASLEPWLVVISSWSAGRWLDSRVFEKSALYQALIMMLRQSRASFRPAPSRN
jgi:hypothetical protein